MKIIDLTGQRFGRLIVLSRTNNDSQGKPRWICKCDCGAETTVASADLKKKGRGTKSCGCLARERASARVSTHRMSKHPAYAVWRSMLARCRNSQHYAWHNYGGRGITVADEWGVFERFWADMGPSYAPGLTLDRRDNDKGYSASNCRWTDRRTQAQNKRTARVIDTPKGPMNVSEAAREFGVKASTILYRIKQGWPDDKLLIRPDFRNAQQGFRNGR